MSKTVVTLARELSRAFVAGERISSETARPVRLLADGSPEWMIEVIRAAHGDMMPDDWRYEMIEDVCDAISNLDDDDTEISDAVAGIEPSICTADLTRWLASRNDRYAYCDDASKEMGIPSSAGIVAIIQAGQIAEYAEIASAVVDALACIADDDT